MSYLIGCRACLVDEMILLLLQLLQALAHRITRVLVSSTTADTDLDPAAEAVVIEVFTVAGVLSCQTSCLIPWKSKDKMALRLQHPELFYVNASHPFHHSPQLQSVRCQNSKEQPLVPSPPAKPRAQYLAQLWSLTSSNPAPGLLTGLVKVICRLMPSGGIGFGGEINTLFSLQ